MSKHHIEALAHLANMHYIASQIHARTPLVDETGKSIVDYMDDATKHLNESMFHGTIGNPQNSLFSLRRTYQTTQGVMGMLNKAAQNQYDDAVKGNLSPDTAVKNMDDMNAFAEQHDLFLNKGKDIVLDQQNKGLSTKEKVDNAREVIDSIADEHNLLLPGSWTRHGDEPAPNGE